MAAEDLNLKKVSINGAQNTSVPGALSGKTSQNTVDNIFKAFQRFAQSRGVTIKSEDFQRVVNSHPEVFELPLEQQAEAIVKLIIAESAPQEPAQETQETTLQEIVSGSTTQPFSLGSLSEDERVELQEAISKSLSAQSTESANPFGATQTIAQATPLTQTSQPASTTVESETTQTGNVLKPANLSGKDREILESIIQYGTTLQKNQQTNSKVFNAGAQKSENTQKITHMDANSLQTLYIEEYAKNIYLYGAEKHSLEDWNKLTEEEKNQFIKDNNIEKLIETSVGQSQNLFSEFKIDISQTPAALLQLKMLELQAASSKGLSVADFNKLDTISKCATILDTIAAKNPGDLSVFEKDALAIGQIIKDSVVYKMSALNLEDTKNLDVNKMSFSQLYELTKTSGGTATLATWVKDYLATKGDDKMSELEQLTYNLLKNIPEYVFDNFGTEAGLTALEQSILLDEDYKSRYEQAETISEKAEIKAEYFYAKYGDDSEKFMATLSDAIKHGNIIEANALAKLAYSDDVDMSNTKAAFENTSDANTLGVLLNIKGQEGYQVGLNAIKQTFMIMEQRAKEGRISYEQLKNDVQNQVDKLNGSEVAELTDDIDQYGESVQEGVVQGVATKLEHGEVEDKDVERIGQNIGKTAEKVQDVVVDQIVKNNKISIKGRTSFTKAFVKHNGYGAQRCVAMHAIATFGDDPDAQKEVFGAIQTSIETNVPKNQAIHSLKGLADQIPECESSIQADVHESITNGKYLEVGIYAASNIYRYDESAQAKALAVSYATGKIEIIEAATLQVSKMAEAAVRAMRNEIAAQISAMEERHMLSALDEYALRQLKKELGFGVDTSTDEFKSKKEAYIEELKSLPRSEVYKRICSDIQSWPTDVQTIILEAIVKYCPELFAMLLDRYGDKLLSSFGQLNSATKNAILIQMLRSPSKRSEAMAYMKANPNVTYSDEVKELYNEIYEMCVANGTMLEDDDLAQKFNPSEYQTVPSGLYSQTSLMNIGQKYNWSMTSDIDGNVGLIS